jgi:hypothetical protein
VTANGKTTKCSSTTRVPGGGRVIPIEPPARDRPADGAPNVGSRSGPIQVDPAPGAGSGAGSGVGSAGRATAEPPVHKPTVMPIPMPVDPPTGPRPDEAAVRRAVAPILAALGLDGAAIVVTGYPALAIITVAPMVDGLQTAGYETRLQYDGTIRLTGGSGWLAPSKPGAGYPLISAQRALDGLPRPEIALACTDREPASCVLPPTVITGARLGLALRHDAQDGALLVPAWLYAVRGRAAGWPQLVAIAVDPAYLQPPVTKQLPPVPAQPAPGGPNDSSGSGSAAPPDSGGGSGNDPGTTATGSAGRPDQPPPTK